jgi:prephenate dehydratase
MPSTAAAAQALVTNGVGCAAICSKLCATLFGLEVLREGIQDENSEHYISPSCQVESHPRSLVNFTRFYIIATNYDYDVPPAFPRLSQKHALVRLSSQITAPPSTKEGCHVVGVTHLLTALNIRATRIDRRPSAHATPFHDVYFVELQEEDEKPDAESAIVLPSNEWTEKVEQAMARVSQRGGEAQLLGVW